LDKHKNKFNKAEGNFKTKLNKTRLHYNLPRYLGIGNILLGGKEVG